MAMTDYPYAASFLEPMPAFPVGASCQGFKDVEPLNETQRGELSLEALTDRQTQVLTALKNASDIYFNYTG